MTLPCSHCHRQILEQYIYSECKYFRYVLVQYIHPKMKHKSKSFMNSKRSHMIHTS